MKKRPDKLLERGMAILTLTAVLVVWSGPSPALAEDPLTRSPQIRIYPSAEQGTLPLTTDEDQDKPDTMSVPIYENPWFWVAIAVTSCAAGVSIYLITQQEPTASLTLGK